MKYLKLFEKKKEEDESIEILEICFQETMDKGYNVYIDQDEISIVDFEIPIVHIDDAKSVNNKKIPCFSVSIDKINESFNIKDIMENLLFIESYIKDELNLIIAHLYIIGIDIEGDSCYYENIKTIPTNKNIYEITIYFTKA